MSTEKVKLLPSLISADLMNLEKEIRSLEPYCDGFHIDVMDYHFVPNLTWGPAFIEQIASITKHPLTIHLMVQEPESLSTLIKARPGDTIIFHIESHVNPQRLSTFLKQKKLKVGLSLKPSTPLSTIKQYLPLIDELLLMSVQPGFSGQSFIPESLDRLKKISREKKETGMPFMISMDGGIDENNINQLYQNGMEAAGIASAIFSKPDPIKALIHLRKLCDN